MSEERLEELRNQIDRRLCSTVIEKPIKANSSDIMTVFAHRFISERGTIPVEEWVSYRCGSVIGFRSIIQRRTTRIASSLREKSTRASTTLRTDADRANSFNPGFFRCDSSVEPIDSYEKFKELVTTVTFDEIETQDQGESKPYSVYRCDRDDQSESDHMCNLLDGELIFGADCSSRTVVETVNTATMKPKRMLKSLDNDDDFLDCFETDRKDYFVGENPLCMFIFAMGEFELYIIDESESAMYLIVKDNKRRQPCWLCDWQQCGLSLV